MDRAAAIADAAPASYWLDDPAAPPPSPPLVGTIDVDLAVVGGGYSGLWTALLAKTADPARSVALVESDRCGWGASGRNGGFCSASLTHGLANGVERFPQEIAVLQRLGRANLDAIAEAVDRWSIPCDFERTGELTVATASHQVAQLQAAAELARRHGDQIDFLDRDAARSEVDSPTYLGALWDREGCALVHPARLAWGLRQACLDLGVHVFENTPVELAEQAPGSASPAGSKPRPLRLVSPLGCVRAERAALATNAHPALVRRLRRYIVPVYDYVLMSEPLTPDQLAGIGWRRRQGIGGAGNQFVYYRLTADNRVLFGGYDAIYHFGNAIRPSLEYRRATFLRLAGFFAETFPSLEDVHFTHAWAGAIDTCSRFCAFFDLAHRGRVASVAGYTGLGVGASRFGAQVMLDLLSGEDTERTRLRFVRRKPLPFPPEPLRYAGIQLTRWSMARADENGGRRNPWLRTLDGLGMGFDS